MVSRKTKVSSKTDPIAIKARAAQAFAKKQRESAKEKLKRLKRQAELQKKLWKAKEKVERVKMEAEQHSMTEEAQKTRQIETEAIRLEVEAEALENEQQGLKDFEDEESVFVTPRQEIAKEVKPIDMPENSVTLDDALMSTSTPKQGI